MKNTLRPQLMMLPFLAVTFVAATCVRADDAAERNRFYLESIRPAIQHLESIAPQQTDIAGIVVPTADTYDLSMGGDIISLRRNFSRSVVDGAGPLHVAFRENLVTEAGFNMGSTGLSFSSTTTQVKDLVGLSLSNTRTDVMGLRQAFGGGDSASTMALTRTTTTQALASGDVSNTVDALSFHSGLTKTTDLALQASHSTTNVKQGLEAVMLGGTLKMTFSGGETPFSYTTTHQFNQNTDIRSEKMDFGIPMEAYKGKAIGEFHSDFTTTNGAAIGQRTAHLAMPWRMGDQTWSLDHMILDQNDGKGAGMVETTTTRLISPFRIGKSPIATEGTRIVVQQGNTDTETLLAKVTAPLLGGNAVVQRQTVRVETPTTSSETEQLALTLPMIKLGKVASFTGSRLSTDAPGAADQDLTNVSLTADPLKPLHIEAQYQIDDRGPLRTLTSRQVHTKWSVCDKTTLTGRFSEAEVAGSDTPNTLRLIEFVRDRTGSGIGLRAGLASYELPGTEVENARRFELTAGKPQTIALSAAYSEYDPNSFARLPESGTVAVMVEHGTPESFTLRCRYEDQPSRPEPLRAVELATKALGASLQFTYANNPMAPDGKTVLQTDQYGAAIGTKALGATLQLSYAANPMSPDGKTLRQADQYEATVGRKILGDVNLELGYRYLSYTDDNDNDQNIRIKLDGGKEDGRGKLALAFLTGDFAPAGAGGALPPSSALDLSYSRKWGALGRISLSLKHQTAATTTLGDDTTEGRLEFNRQF